MSVFNFIVRVAICFLFIFLPLQTLDQWLYDRFFRLRGVRRQATDVVLLRVNDAKLQQHFQLPSPTLAAGSEAYQRAYRKYYSYWIESFYLPLLNRIQQDKPKLVIFTPFFESSDRNGQPPFHYQNVLFAAMLNDENKLIPPSPTLGLGHNIGFANIFPDSDNLVRKSFLIYSSGASLALKAFQKLKGYSIYRDLHEPVWIDYRGPTGSYPTLDAWQLLEENIPADSLANKIVIIGREGGTTSDLETPFGKMSRLEIHGNILDTFLSGREIRIAPRWISLTLAAVAVMISISIIWMFPLTLAWLFLILFSLLLLLTTLFCFSVFKVWIGMANPIFGIFGTHLLMLGYKLSRQEEEQWKVQQETQYLKDLDQFKNNFISLFSHDLKTPIAKIKAVTDRLLVSQSTLSEPVKEGLQSIDRTSAELARIITDILKVTKMESKGLEMNHEVIDLNRLVENAIQRLSFFAEEKNIKLVLDLEPLFSIEGDQQLIQEVVTNLIENAIKYSPPNTEVVIKTSEIEDEMIRVSVTDQGHGIPEEEIPRVTGKFYRCKATKETTKGTGLGLYLSKYFVELHKGSLDIRSKLGKGTEVSFSLPMQQST